MRGIGILKMAIPIGGGFPVLDTQTVTTGLSGVLPDRQRGFIAGSLGSCSDATSNLYSGAAVQQLYHDETGGAIAFKVAGVRANSGWTRMIVDGGIPLLRASAAFSTAGGNSSWIWTSSNLFGGSGTVHSVVFS